MKKILKHAKEYRLAILTGFCIGTSYIPFPPWALLFCFVPLWVYADSSDSTKKVFFAGWISQALLALIGFHWIAYTTVVFGHMPWVVGVFVLLLFASAANLYIPLALALSHWLLQRRQFPLWWRAAIYVLSLAALENIFPMIFPWNYGYPWFYSGLPIYQTAEIWGFQGLSLLTIFFNGCIFYVWRRRTTARPWKKPAMAMGVLFVILSGWGYWLEQRLPETNNELKVALIQPNIGNQEKIAAEKGRQFRSFILNELFELTNESLDANPSLILWPETAYPTYADDHYKKAYYGRQLRKFIKETPAAFLIGAYSADESLVKGYNAMFLFDEQAELIHPPYRKTILLAFGEYFPGSQYIPFLKDLIPAISDFNRGQGPRVFSWDLAHLGLQICYEGLFPDFSRELSKQGADIFFNVTNDSWFGVLFEPLQHMYMTLARGIEYRRPIVRSTNTGISTVMAANGQILVRSPLHQKWQKTQAVPFRQDAPQTFYSLYGGWLTPLLLALAFAAVVATFFSRRKSSK